MSKYFFNFLIISLLVILIQGVFSALNILFPLNIFLVILVFITIIFGFNWGFIFSIFAGFALNLFSYLPLGSFIIIYLVVLLSVSFLYKNVFINLSLYTSLLLTFLATLIYQLLILLFNFMFYFLNLINIYITIDRTLLIYLGKQIILNLLVMSILFILAKATSKRLNLAFLIKNE